MRQSKLFTKTRKEAPKDETSKNAILLTRGGFINKEMAGVYSYLPLGFKVLQKIENIIREEMNAIGGAELLLTTLQDAELWKTSDRWDDKAVDIWLKTKLANGKEVGLAWTHEESMANLMKHHIDSYKDLPIYTYQIQTKFRNELRAKSGLMRGREFLMKDLYSFTKNEKELEEFYEKCAAAYMKIFERVGIAGKTYRTFAAGGSFSKFSDEFQTLSEAGEDTIYVDTKKKIAVNKEVYTDDVLKELGLKKEDLREEKAIEVGNIFKQGTRFSEPLGLMYKDEKGIKKPVIMGAYGIGLGRLMAAIVETHNDEKGIMWPESVAPFVAHIVAFSGGEKEARELYEKMVAQNLEVLYDDRRDLSPGEKLAEADLIGIPKRIIVSEKSLKAGGAEVKMRDSEKTEIVPLKDIILKNVK
ncbi:MAG: aminoacyl--tRNA ligase-related protein [Candidatus Spechtbacterales bacterium]